MGCLRRGKIADDRYRLTKGCGDMLKLNHRTIRLAFAFFISLGMLLLPNVCALADWPSTDFGSQQHRIHIHKLSHTLELFEKGNSQPIKVYPIATAKNDGDKERPGDNRTPISWGYMENSIPGAGHWVPSAAIPFVVEDIYYAGDWTHDFGDGNGEIAGAYGPWFISLNTGWDGIGIHGTHAPESIGTNASEGCIRMYNQDVAELKEIICQYNGGIGVNVVITED